MLDDVPSDIGAYFSGHTHEDIFQLFWIYKNLEDFAAKGFKYLADEMDYRWQKKIDYILRSKGNSKDLTSLFDKRFYCPFSHAKVLQKANDLGIKILCVDDPKDSRNNSASMTQSNEFMAAKILPLVEEGKVLCLNGSGHLYSAPRASYAKDSMQVLLQQKGFSTYALEIMHDVREMRSIRPLSAPVRETDERAAREVCNLFYNNLEKVQRTKPVTINWHDYTPCAGITIPDKTILLSKKAQQWRSELHLLSNIRQEEKVWNAIESAYSPPVL